MKRFPLILFSALTLIITAVSCSDDEDTWEKYSDWRVTNETWIQEQAGRTNADGTPYFTRLVPAWDTQAYVLIHYFNDRTLTAGNLSPLETSTVDVKYAGYTCDGAMFDSSYALTANGDSIFRTKCTSVIRGWLIALEDMHVGDSCEVVIPYRQAYNESEYGSIKPYSCLKFNLKLVDIPYYEIKK